MKTITKLQLMAAFSLLLVSCGTGGNGSAEADYQVVPLPDQIEMTEGKAFALTASTRIIYPEGNEKMERNAAFLADFLELSTGIRPEITTDEANKDAVILSLGLQNENPEAYRIQIDRQNIRIEGASEAAVFYGLQTLRKSVPVGNYKHVTFSPATITDAPRFGYRGMMLDVARHFQPVEFVKKYIDLLALHNINRFHWHLTDDQGWRITIDSYPKLMEISSMRRETVIGRNTDEYDGTPHGGYYTKEELKDVVAYAAERYITIIPEVDLPGHMLAALAAYPELGCTGGPYEVARKWGIFEDVLCPGKEETFTFLEGVLTEVMEIFPSRYIHIGGDEAPKTRWEKCPDCQARIKDLGLKDRNGHTAEHYLQSYVTARIEKFLNDHGRSIIGWDEILEGELAPNATVMSWRGMDGGIQAAQMGHDVIMTPTGYCYFDYYQTQDTEGEPLAIGGYVPVEKVYSFEPAPDQLTAEQKNHILGAQANLWTEYISDPEHVEYMTLPRLAAMSEVQWMQPGKKNYDEFLTRLPHLLALYNKLGYHYATHVIDEKSR
ncbi:MAG: GHF20 protein [Proteiniphilum acetatigenes]|uniref:beta-N-acetylhexosaminidase n=1 Tax=Proteiniphilum acetatigenes TaxID=294710 RepID=A0A101HII1_9BACT|nr:MAG: GHF20 protein [Proteiniphilum acetatigenes]